jgi:glycosyltransferase involved in cell wall biosynthesis
MVAEIVPNIVDLSRFRPAAVRPPSTPHLVVARNLEAIYDNATALQAFAQVLARVPDARLTLAGTGPEHAALEALAQRLGVAAQVTFAGRLEREAMAALLRDCAVALNPSRVDNTPNSVLEAWASGVPVVSTNVGGVPFIAQHGVTALLVPPQDAAAMADAVVRVLSDAALAGQLSSNGLAQAQHYTWERVAPRLAEVYRAAIDVSRT